MANHWPHIEARNGGVDSWPIKNDFAACSTPFANEVQPLSSRIGVVDSF
jgi:hypothetical protein